MSEENTSLFFKKNTQVFKEDPEFPHYNNIYLTKSVAPIYWNKTLNISPKEFIHYREEAE
jgi:hypothetical protein